MPYGLVSLDSRHYSLRSANMTMMRHFTIHSNCKDVCKIWFFVIHAAIYNAAHDQCQFIMKTSPNSSLPYFLTNKPPISLSTLTSP